MKPKFLFSILIIVLAVLVWLFLRHQKGGGILPRDTSQPVSAPSMSNATPAVAQKKNNTLQSERLSSVELSKLNDQQRSNAIRQDMESQNVPIHFYGYVTDQDSNPLPTVKIAAHVRHWNVIVPAPFGAQGVSVLIEKESDSNGRFEIHEGSGDVLGIDSISKPGYELDSGALHSFGATSGSSAAPIIFKMWSTNIHEQLITGEKKFQVMPDGRAYFIDLNKGTISETGEGDLKVWIQYTNQPVLDQFSDWSAEIDVINGGLQESDSYSMFTAPTEGYVPSFIWKNQIKGGQHGSIGDKKFYVVLNSGKVFGRIQIDLVAPFNTGIPGLIRLSYAINPSGSRILR